jgi:hypothetical protein
MLGTFLLQPPREPADELKGIPQAADVESITAHVPKDKEFAIVKVPRFTVPRKYVPVVLAAMSPAKSSDWPAEWDQFRMAELTVRTKAGQLLHVHVCDAGKNPLCFSLNGIRRVRGGPYEPLRLGGGEVYASEGHLLTYLLYLIHQEQTGKGDQERIGVVISRLDQSAGRRVSGRP